VEHPGELEDQGTGAPALQHHHEGNGSRARQAITHGVVAASSRFLRRFLAAQRPDVCRRACGLLMPISVRPRVVPEYHVH